jgi:hypothetical protein
MTVTLEQPKHVAPIYNSYTEAVRWRIIFCYYLFQQQNGDSTLWNLAGLLLRYFLNDFAIVPVAPVTTDITSIFPLHKRRISAVRSMLF